jgi:colanic acid biosynthesis protein WcaH
MRIQKAKFIEIIDSTPLVSIDLIIEGEKETYLLGQRLNKPAQGYWFVPGGRIRKNERLSEAFERIAHSELGIECNLSTAKLLGAYDHIYDDNFDSVNGVNTHYVALGYQIKVPGDVMIKFDAQHDQIKWWKKEELLEDSKVHENTKNYFKASA